MQTLESISVAGFKSIRKLHEFTLRPLNVLIGPNGAGKSNFIELFELLAHVASRDLQLFLAKRGGADVMLFGTRSVTNVMRATFIFGRNNYEFALEPALDQLVFKHEIISLPNFAIDVAKFNLGSGHKESMLGLGSPEWGRIAAANVRNRIRKWIVYHFGDTSITSPPRQYQSAVDNEFLRPNGANLAPFLRYLSEQYPKHYQVIVRTIRRVFPTFNEFLYRDKIQDKVQLEWRETVLGNPAMGPLQMSDGTLRFICLATLLLQPTELQPDLILVDEPELGLHPAALEIISALIQRASDRRQIIVATQSADLLRGLDAEDIVINSRNPDTGESTFERLDSERLKYWLEDYSLGALWKMNVFGGGPF